MIKILNTILDTDHDTLVCFQCDQPISPLEDKIIAGFGSKATVWGVWHPTCYPQEGLGEVFAVMRKNYP